MEQLYVLLSIEGLHCWAVDEVHGETPQAVCVKRHLDQVHLKLVRSCRVKRVVVVKTEIVCRFAINIIQERYMYI